MRRRCRIIQLIQLVLGASNIARFCPAVIRIHPRPMRDRSLRDTTATYPLPMLHKKCPKCGTGNPRPSPRRGAKGRQWLRARYACQNCHESFWVIRTTPYYLAVSFGAVIVFTALTWGLTSLISRIGYERQLASAAQALETTAKRAHAGDAAAAYELASKYREGMDVRIDDVQAKIWLERAAEHGYTQAQLELGIASLKGEGVLQDFQAALKWLSRAAEGGNSQARYNLGLLYRHGTGIPADHVKAYVWLNLAAAQGIEPAAAARDATMRLLSKHQIVQAQAEARRLSSMPAGPHDNVSLEMRRANQ